MQRLRAWEYEREAQRRLDEPWTTKQAFRRAFPADRYAGLWTAMQQAPPPTAQQQYALMQAQTMEAAWKRDPWYMGLGNLFSGGAL